ncbi:dihydropteroate synthase [Marivirga tractuosa]|uniref:Dihydropteroate synthase n=1 Tax=Marivirga tractuosa (strain ATCC 23168 / DSM 4126 / NBRC 15989 / NCIMB 1408 / VKM B-1430 / H-43) TaxID=643867 RepID=E4TQJ3_MARTH|nr:dihydropteroate synthase [Marivirga tractuosa]ADR23686.1 Dihydropteroate synthase [Marivirga tractuosa DSM 4126]BDD15633.1 dihydropteroate synthase [Marivirga tractuosa]
MEAKDKAFSYKKTLLTKGNLIDLSRPKVMGIINATPDSFYDGGQNIDIDKAVLKVEEMLKDGADIIDIGGYSTKPNASEVSINEEERRVIPLIETIIEKFPSTVISIDTFRSEVAEKAVAAGASIINDVSGGNLDGEMFNTVAKLKVPYILMHMRGTPASMQKLTDYEHLVKDIVLELSEKLEILRSLQVNDIIIDPGFGFAKTLAQNYEILNNLSYFKQLECPILVGVSRKSMIYKLLGVDAVNALNGTTALNMAALLNGGAILRVHDVKEAVETVKIFNQLTT